MKKYGKEWRKLHQIDNNTKETSYNTENAQAAKLSRQTPISRAGIDALREKANAILDKCVAEEKCFYEEREKESTNPKSTAPVLIETPIININNILSIINSADACKLPLTSLARGMDPAGCCLKFIEEANTLFDVAKKSEIVKRIYVCLVLGKYDADRQGVLPFGKRYIDALCAAIEGTTWYSRKNTELMLKKIIAAFENQTSKNL